MNMVTRQHITILQINDTHGYLEPHRELFWEGNRAVYRTTGGYARILTIFNQVRKECDGAVIALDNGDTLHGTFPAVNSQGEALIEPLNVLGLDAWTAHWDFAYGAKRLSELAKRLNHPLLALNCFHQETGVLAYKPFTVIERSGMRVGVIGIAATIIDKTMPKHFSHGLRFTLGNEELPGQIRVLREREKVDLVVVLSHLGFPQDFKLATEVPGIDVLLSGHTHNRMIEPCKVNNTTIMQSGCHGSFVGRLDVEMSSEGARVRHQLIEVDESFTEDSEMVRVVERAIAPHRKMLSEIVGHTSTALNRNTLLEATMDNLLLQAIADAAGTTIAFSNGWRYGAPIPPGPVTVNDLWNIIPSNPPVSVVDLFGGEMMSMIEENLEHTFAVDPYHQMGGYLKRCLGINVYVKLENPPGSRVQQLFVDGRPVEPAQVYSVAFVTAQAVPEKYGRNRRELDTHAVDALKNYFARHDEVEAELRKSIVAV